MAFQTTTTPGSGYGNPYIDSLIWGCQWTNVPGTYGQASIANPVKITYSFGSGLAFDDYGPFYGAVWLESEKSAFATALSLFESVCNVDFIQTAYTPIIANQSNMVFYLVPNSFSGSNVMGSFEVPDNTYTSNYGYFNYQYPNWNNLNLGSEGFYTIVHELGHGLGLAHPHDGGTEIGATTFPGVSYLDDADTGVHNLNQGIWSVMSYNADWDSLPGPSSENFGQGILGAFDIAALQAIYGANTNFATGSNTYTLPTLNANGTGWRSIWDAGGIDTISNAGSSLSSVINLNAAPLTGANAGGYVSSNAGIVGGYTIAYGVVIENAIGGSGNDYLIGNSAGNVLNSGLGNDYLEGNAGNDTLAGGAGNDIMYGGAGNDSFDWDADSRLGNDIMYGGAGDDTYVVDSINDVIVELANEGTDTIWTAFNYSIATVSNVENLSLFGTENINATGNSLNNTLKGNSGNNIIEGNAGNDTLAGGAGNDIMYGGAGNDSFDWDADSRLGNDIMYGGAGDDAYVVDSTNDIIVELANEGTDTIWTAFNYSIATVSNVENLSLFGTENINATGNSLNNTLKGNSGNNAINGGSGIDTAVYAGAAASYTLALGANSAITTTITDRTASRDGTDTLVNTERLKFSDTNVALDVGRYETAGQAYRLYKAAFNRASDDVGLGFWIHSFDTGNTLNNVAQGFINSDEFPALYGVNSSNSTFLSKLYNNVLGRVYDQTGYDFWLRGLNKGLERNSILAQFSESPENIANTMGLIGQGVRYTEWLG